MSESFEQIIAAADWKKLTPRLMYYADSLIRRCAWRGLPVQAIAQTKVSVESFGADDFMQEAIDRLLAGRRKYNHGVDLEQNLRSIIRSMIWSLNKSSNRAGIVELSTPSDDEGADPIDSLPSPTVSPSASAIAVEKTEHQRRMLNEFEASIAGETELLTVFTALKEEDHTPRSLEKLTAIPAARASELKRQLRRRLERFIEKRAASK
jgi:DNA-directed RNA polymerase specialized sigma24 family protein